MNAKIWQRTVIILLAVSFTASADEKLSVYAVNYPLAYFAERIGGSSVNVVLPVPADIDPAFWEPDASVIAEFQQADLILLNGAGYANWSTHLPHFSATISV